MILDCHLTIQRKIHFQKKCSTSHPPKLNLDPWNVSLTLTSLLVSYYRQTVQFSFFCHYEVHSWSISPRDVKYCIASKKTLIDNLLTSSICSALEVEYINMASISLQFVTQSTLHHYKYSGAVIHCCVYERPHSYRTFAILTVALCVLQVWIKFLRASLNSSEIIHIRIIQQRPHEYSQRLIVNSLSYRHTAINLFFSELIGLGPQCHKLGLIGQD